MHPLKCCPTRFSIRQLLISTAMVAVAIVAARTAFIAIAGPVIPPSLAAKLKVGMSHSEVEAIVGRPADIGDDGCWNYSKSLNPGWATIYFDESGRYESIGQELAYP